ncbi:MAG: hypothetical protein CBE07_001165 [Pelagibacteraceae bacterium TMED247]|nr:MAG: hypothetical protein CBE07_001165 [Pelagibacteraceae bacterium TMED247]
MAEKENDKSVLIDLFEEKKKLEEKRAKEREEEIDWIASHSAKTNEELAEENPLLLLLASVDRMANERIKIEEKVEMFHALAKVNIFILGAIGILTSINIIFFISDWL